MTKRRNGMRDGESGREKSSPRKIEELSRERAREWDSALLRTVFVAAAKGENILGQDEMGISDVKSSRWG